MGGVVAIDILLRRDPGRVWRVEAGDAQERVGLVPVDIVDGLVGDEGSVPQVGAAGAGQGFDREAFIRVRDAVFNAHGALPNLGGGRQAEADIVEFCGRLRSDPGAVGIRVGAGLVGDF